MSVLAPVIGYGCMSNRYITDNFFVRIKVEQRDDDDDDDDDDV